MEPTISFSTPAYAGMVNAPVDIAPVPTVPVSPEVPTTDFQPEVPVTVAPQVPQYENINVFAESISSSSSNSPNQAVFDIVLSVSWNCPTTGDYKTAKILKTIGFDKESLFAQTGSQPVTAVESVQTKPNKTLKTLRELAGIPGKGNFV